MAAAMFVSVLVGLVGVSCAYPFSGPSIDMSHITPEEFAMLLDRVAEQETEGPAPVPQFSTNGLELGQVTALDVDSNGDLFVFHRADRSWTLETFEEMEDVLTESAKTPIASDTIYQLDPATGQAKGKFGADIFNVPHGLKIDKDDNIWVTDVGRHQVLRFPKDSHTPDLELGEKFVPGVDDSHFCKPTDVAVASNGQFFVSDGYCNSRIMKFSKDGKIIGKWGTSSEYTGPVTPYHLSIPHSITLVEHLNLVCVADRENRRATCFHADLDNKGELGVYDRTIIGAGEAGKIFSIYYNHADETMVSAVEISRRPFLDDTISLEYPPRAATFSLTGQMLGAWAPILPTTIMEGDSLIHSVCTSEDGKDFFLADILQQKVLKFTIRRPSQPEADKELEAELAAEAAVNSAEEQSENEKEE